MSLSFRFLVASRKKKNPWHIRFLHLTPGKFPLCSQATERRSDHCCHSLKCCLPHFEGPWDTQKPEDISIWEIRYRQTLYMYQKTLPSTSALTCHFLALPTSEHSVLGVVSLTQHMLVLWCWYTSTRKEAKRKDSPPLLSSANNPPLCPWAFSPCVVLRLSVSYLDWASVEPKFHKYSNNKQ